MRRILFLLLGALVLAGCSTSKDAVATTQQEFTFVAPGGQTTILYDPPSARGASPELSGDSLLKEGAQVGLADYAGQVVIVNIWGSWCGPCRAEAPDLEFVAQQTRADGVAVLGIDVRDDRAAARDFVQDRGLTYDSIFDPASRSLAALDGYPRNVVPSTLVLDRQHRVAAVYLTTIRPSDLLQTVQRLAAETPRPA
ncbi:TlpA family protein disulfide reductase [Pseudonocardia pini]|uniref:TlpA family protein disulfide reductase n=1 Tax=Pseudonocardia pini TaxID=2758030 RepID=UPI0015F046FB|nr:TlpA disulfide reductase family protein [Pseudonocardia pini]